MASRQKIVLTRTVRQFLRQPRTARLATLGPDGYPHIVPIWFILDGDDLLFGSDGDERKVWNARRHPKGAVVIGGEPETDPAGYMIQGDLRVEADADKKIMRRLADHYGAGDEADEWGQSKRVVIRLKPRRVIRVW